MLFDKLTNGIVVQTFNDAGECVSQHFIASDVEYETSDGDPINCEDMPLAGKEYNPFDMVQPNQFANLSEQLQENLKTFLDDIDDALPGETDVVNKVCEIVFNTIEESKCVK